MGLHTIYVMRFQMQHMLDLLGRQLMKRFMFSEKLLINIQ